METNELPEDVKQQIDQQIDLIRQDDNQTIDYTTGYKDGVEFGYRLALQSKEEEIKRLDEHRIKIEEMELQERNSRISLTKENERLTIELGAMTPKTTYPCGSSEYPS